MDNRKKNILKAVVEDYIHNAEPVGSKALATQHEMNISPATLRNEMAALEAMGYLEQPHTSAGRIPTPQGYRFYVDELMQKQALTIDEMQEINRVMRNKMKELDRLLAEAGSIVADLTQYTAVSAIPASEKTVFRKLELFLSEPTALVAVLVLDNGVIKNKWVRWPRHIDAAALSQLSSALNTVLAGQPSLDTALIERCVSLAGAGAEYLPVIVDFIQDILNSSQRQQVYIEGQSHLLLQPEYNNVRKAQRALERLSEEKLALAQLPFPESPDSVRIHIGLESVSQALSDASVVMASYPMGEGLRGMIGVIGPTRMDYGKLTAHLSYFASRLGNLLQGDAAQDKISQYDEEDST